MARKARVYHRRPIRTRRWEAESECFVSFDGEDFEVFKPKPKGTGKHKIEFKNGEWVLIEKEPR